VPDAPFRQVVDVEADEPEFLRDLPSDHGAGDEVVVEAFFRGVAAAVFFQP
jgi:hypothetical protein